MTAPPGTYPLAIRLLRGSRFYSVPYLTTAGFCALLVNTAAPSPQSVLIAMTLPACFAVGIAAWNDLAHRKADHRSGRRQSVQQQLVLIGSAGSLAAFGLAIVGGMGAVIGLTASLAAGVVYAFCKSLPIVSNLIRGGTSLRGSI